MNLFKNKKRRRRRRRRRSRGEIFFLQN